MAKREQAVGKSTGKSKTKMKVYNSREAKKVVLKNGYEYIRTRGDHDYFMKESKMIIIAKKLNRMIWERTVKEHQLILNI